MTDTLSDQVVTETRERLARSWVEALESGNYQQGYEWLRVGDNYCCLGVLADVAIKLDLTQARWTTGGRHSPLRVGEQPVFGLETPGNDLVERKILPKDLADLMGFKDRDGEKYETPDEGRDWVFDTPAIEGGTFESLAEANDSKVVSFDDVAYAVREHYSLGRREAS